MAKIDCSKTVNFLREYNRMCNSFNDYSCNDCPMYKYNNGELRYCENLIKEFPDRAIEIVQKWSDEHPQKTRLDDLKEKYPNYRFYENDQCPDRRPAVFGYCDACADCRNKKQTLRYCWDEPVNGGATGKVVK